MLRAGGNAVDALCAAACMAFVAESPLCSPGGGGALLLGEAGRLQLLDFFAVVPGLGRGQPDAMDFHDVAIDFGPTVQRFHVGTASAAVPGTVLLGLLEAHRRHGRLPLRVLIEPAAAAARAGCPPSPQLRFIVDILRPILTLTPATRALFFDAEGEPWFSNPRLADTLEAIARDGEPLVRGPLARALVEACGPERGGLLTAEDLARYAPAWREPLVHERGPWSVFTNPLPSSGGTLLTRGLHLAEALDLSATPWLDPEHAAKLAALLAAVDSSRDPDAGGPGDPLVRAERLLAAQRARRNLGSTTHISVLDDTDQLASLTMSNGEGCGHTVEAYGIHLNNFLGEDDINPEGFHRQAPGTWMTTMMAPSAVLHRGRPALVLGTGGSKRIRSALLVTLLHVLASARSLEEAVLAPRLHVEGEQLWFELPGLPEASAESLQAAWPDATAFAERSMFFGGVHVAARGGHGLHGVGDPRRGGAVRTVS